MESFKLNLYQDEIYVFHAERRLLKFFRATPLPIDFAFEIHSNIGYHCIGAKVNGRIVPLNTLLRSGDQIEIITSKNQTPNPDWEQFVVSHKAKAHIRRFIREEIHKQAQVGRELWEKKVKRRKVHINDDELEKFVHVLKFNDIQDFYLAIADQKAEPDTIIEQYVIRSKPSNSANRCWRYIAVQPVCQFSTGIDKRDLDTGRERRFYVSACKMLQSDTRR